MSTFNSEFCHLRSQGKSTLEQQRSDFLHIKEFRLVGIVSSLVIEKLTIYFKGIILVSVVVSGERQDTLMNDFSYLFLVSNSGNLDKQFRKNT